MSIGEAREHPQQLAETNLPPIFQTASLNLVLAFFISPSSHDNRLNKTDQTSKMTEPPHFQHEQQSLSSFATRAALARSRFQEGSMNDRVSAAPPAGFLGGTTMTDDDVVEVGRLAYTTTSSSDTTFNAGRHGLDKDKMNRRSVQSNISGGSSSSKKSGFFGPLWDGVKERLGLGRSKSSYNFGKENNGGGSNRSSRSSSHDGDHVASTVQQQQQQQRPRGHSSAYTPSSSAPNTPTFPTFDAAAATAKGAMPTREEIMANYQSLMKAGFFDAHAIQSSRHAPPGSRPGTLPSQMSQSRPGSSADRVYQQQQEEEQQQQPESPFRGTKRNRAEGDDATANGNITPGQRLIKKLRKSTSRLAGDAKAFSGQPLSSPTEELFAGVRVIPQQSQHGSDQERALGGVKKLTKPPSRKSLRPRGDSFRGRLGIRPDSREGVLPDVAADWTAGRSEHRHEPKLPLQHKDESVYASPHRQRRAEQRQRQQQQHRAPLSSPARAPPQHGSPRNSTDRNASHDQHPLSSPAKPQRKMPLQSHAHSQSPHRSSMPPSSHANSTSSRHSIIASSASAPTVVSVPPPSFHYPQRRRPQPQPTASQPLRVSPEGGRGNRRAAAVGGSVSADSKHYASMDVVMVDMGDVENRMRY